MSSSDPNSAVFLTDSADEIERKIKEYAFSGGQETKKMQEELGANLEVDVSYQWLRFFYEDDEELDRPRRFFALPRGGRFVDRPLRCVGFRFARGRPRLRDELLELDELLDRERLRRRGILAFYSKPSISWQPATAFSEVHFPLQENSFRGRVRSRPVLARRLAHDRSSVTLQEA